MNCFRTISKLVFGRAGDQYGLNSALKVGGYFLGKKIEAVSYTRSNIGSVRSTSNRIYYPPECKFMKTMPDMKVTILGANGCTGRPLALLLKQSPFIDEIALYDCSSTCSFAEELDYIDTRCKVTGYPKPSCLCQALDEAQVVIIVARNQMNSFEANVPLITELALYICEVCPTAFVILATEPVESLFPLLAEVMRLRGTYNPRKALGCVELHCVRANTALADFLQIPPESVYVPVIGGCNASTMVPVLSAAVNPSLMTQEQIECITSCIMCGNATVSSVKGSIVSTPNLAGAYAIARTTLNVVKSLQGRKDIKQSCYCDTQGGCAPDCRFFCSEATYGPSGIEKMTMPELTKFEDCLLRNCLPEIKKNICRATWLAYGMCAKPCCSCPTIPDPKIPCRPDFPEARDDDYLASICQNIVCKTICTDLVWRPGPTDYDPIRAARTEHQLPSRIGQCPCTQIPRSVLVTQEIIKSTKEQELLRKC